MLCRITYVIASLPSIATIPRFVKIILVLFLVLAVYLGGYGIFFYSRRTSIALTLKANPQLERALILLYRPVFVADYAILRKHLLTGYWQDTTTDFVEITPSAYCRVQLAGNIRYEGPLEYVYTIPSGNDYGRCDYEVRTKLENGSDFHLALSVVGGELVVLVTQHSMGAPPADRNVLPMLYITMKRGTKPVPTADRDASE